MENNLNQMITNAMLVDNSNIDKKRIMELIKQIKVSLFNNKEAIEVANEIDLNNDNGFKFEFDVIENIFNIIEKEDCIYGEVTLSQKDDEKKIIYGKQIMNIGNVALVNDGNTYVIIEMILRNILANNTLIINTRGYMYGTNNLIVQIIRTVLEKFDVSKDLVQLYVSESNDELFSNYANINLVLCVGDHGLQRSVLTKCSIPTIVSGYENFDLYIEDDTNVEFISNILGTGLNINVYINRDTKLDYETAIIVDSLDEAVAQINYNGSGYSASIFTSSSDNASKFIKGVHSKIVTVNASPTIERICDIKQEDLVREKTIIYPLEFKFENK